MDPFEIDVLFAFETAQHRCTLTIEKVKISQVQDKLAAAGLLSDIATDLFE
jgi:hypothetical protein